MKKNLFLLLLFCVGLALFAEDARRFDVLTRHKYKDVKIDGITWRGIRIRHSSGNRYITDKDLTADEKKALSKEIEIWKDKLERHNRRYGGRKKIIEQRSKELMDLQKNLPKMNRNQICKWFQDRIGTNPYKNDFKSSYNTAYLSVRSAPAVMRSIEARLRTIDTADFKKMAGECLSKTTAQANGILRRRVGAALNHPNFTENLRVRFVWVPLNERNAFVNKMLAKEKAEKICYICKKNPSISAGSYCKACAAKICTKCKKNVVDEKSKEKVCKKCQDEASGKKDAPKSEEAAPEEASENPFA